MPCDCASCRRSPCLCPAASPNPAGPAPDDASRPPPGPPCLVRDCVERVGWHVDRAVVLPPACSRAGLVRTDLPFGAHRPSHVQRLVRLEKALKNRRFIRRELAGEAHRAYSPAGNDLREPVVRAEQIDGADADRGGSPTSRAHPRSFEGQRDGADGKYPTMREIAARERSNDSEGDIDDDPLSRTAVARGGAGAAMLAP